MKTTSGEELSTGKNMTYSYQLEKQSYERQGGSIISRPQVLMTKHNYNTIAVKASR